MNDDQSLVARRSLGLTRAAWVGILLAAMSGCEPEVGSARWCEAMREKPRGDWTVNEGLDFARYCLFETEEE